MGHIRGTKESCDTCGYSCETGIVKPPRTLVDAKKPTVITVLICRHGAPVIGRRALDGIWPIVPKDGWCGDFDAEAGPKDIDR